MTRKIITGVISAILLVTIAVFAAEKAMERKYADKYGLKACEQQGRLLDQLAEAYKVNDREKMGEIINKMQERREKMERFVKLNRWHRWAHRRMMGQMGPGWGQGQQMAGPGWNRDWAMQNQGWNQCCAMNGPCGNCGWAMPNQGCPMAGPQWGQFQPMPGRGFGGCNNMMGNCGPMAGGFRQMPCQQGMGMGSCMPQQNGPGQMPGCGRGFQREWTPGPGAENMGQQEWNMPRRERMNVPPPEWGW
jgi:hypothetical protein